MQYDTTEAASLFAHAWVTRGGKPTASTASSTRAPMEEASEKQSAALTGLLNALYRAAEEGHHEVMSSGGGRIIAHPRIGQVVVFDELGQAKICSLDENRHPADPWFNVAQLVAFEPRLRMYVGLDTDPHDPTKQRNAVAVLAEKISEMIAAQHAARLAAKGDEPG